MWDEEYERAVERLKQRVHQLRQELNAAQVRLLEVTWERDQLVREIALFGVRSVPNTGERTSHDAL